MLLLLVQAQATAGVCEPLWWAQAGRQGVAVGGSASASGSWSTVRSCGDNLPGELIVEGKESHRISWI
jgi:hypothetical protein